MILFDLTNSEQHPVYRALEASNISRQYNFLESIVAAAVEIGRAFLSAHIIKALNAQAITCLHINVGEYRPCEVRVGDYCPPEHYRVDALMEDFVNVVNRSWEASDPVELAAFVLWRLNYIHPFINGNGRAARAASYFVLCVKMGGWLPGNIILPALIKRERQRYVDALQTADRSLVTGTIDLTALHGLLSELLSEQINVGPNGIER